MVNISSKSFAIILSAGFGSRLHNITKDCPKSLILVNGRAILDYQIRGYLNAGLTQENILVITGYKGDMIESFLSQNYPQNREIIHLITNWDKGISNGKLLNIERKYKVKNNIYNPKNWTNITDTSDIANVKEQDKQFKL